MSRRDHKAPRVTIEQAEALEPAALQALRPLVASRHRAIAIDGELGDGDLDAAARVIEPMAALVGGAPDAPTLREAMALTPRQQRDALNVRRLNEQLQKRGVGVAQKRPAGFARAADGGAQFFEGGRWMSRD